ncbi:MFS transporter [Kribbella sp. NPDC051718]|uniref:MFS transporter n=1 Tax=Kribbella sp. NPDC051718 TaxID=3155168 RepID=UPI00342FA31D
MNANQALPIHAPATTIQDPRKRRAILIAVCIALMAVIASVSGLNVAQPQLALTFDASQSTVLWMINLYTITLAALLLPLGALGDRLGRKPMLLAGLIVFGIASIAAGLAQSTEVMLAARLLSGIGAAMIMPVTLAVITSTFPDEDRSKAIGVWTGVAGGGGLLGMYLSAVLVDVATWRWLFVLPAALVATAIALTLHSIPNSTEPASHRYDAVGSLTSVVAVVGLASGSVSLLTVFGVQAGIFVVLFPYFQAVLGWSGLRSTPGPSTEAITSALPRERQGVASALNDVTREFGTALGVALLGAVLSAGYRNAIDSRLDGLPASTAAPARDGIANAIAAANDAGPRAEALIRAAQDSFVTGWQHAMWVGAGIMTVLFAYVVARGPRTER